MNSSSSVSQNAKNRAIIRRPMTKTSNLRKSAPACVVITNSRSTQSSGKSTSYLNRRIIPSVSNPTYINDSNLIELRNRFYENPSFDSIDNDTLQKLQAHLREYIQDRALYEDYDSAEKATSLSELVKLELSKRPNKNSSLKVDSNSHQSNLESAPDINDDIPEKNQDKNPDDETDANSKENYDYANEDEKKRLKEFEEKWKNKFESFDQVTEQKNKELEEKQSTQLKEFENIWSTEKPQKYRKASSQLLQLKKIERTLALSGQFDQARVIHAEAEQLAAKEQKELQALLIKDYRSAKENFLLKQNQEKQKLFQSRQEIRSTMEIQKNAEYNKFMKRNVVVQDKWKEAQRGTMRERSGVIKPDYGVSVSNLNQNKSKLSDNIIPPLFAPNDPAFIEEDEKKMREKRKKQLQYHKKNAEVTLLEYTVQPSPRDENDEDVNSKEENKKESSNALKHDYIMKKNNDNIQKEENNENKQINDFDNNQKENINDNVQPNTVTNNDSDNVQPNTVINSDSDNVQPNTVINSDNIQKEEMNDNVQANSFMSLISNISNNHTDKNNNSIQTNSDADNPNNNQTDEKNDNTQTNNLMNLIGIISNEQTNSNSNTVQADANNNSQKEKNNDNIQTNNIVQADNNVKAQTFVTTNNNLNNLKTDGAVNNNVQQKADATINSNSITSQQGANNYGIKADTTSNNYNNNNVQPSGNSYSNRADATVNKFGTNAPIYGANKNVNYDNVMSIFGGGGTKK